MPRTRLELQKSLLRIAVILAFFGGLVYLFAHARQDDEAISGAVGVVNANALYLKSGPGELYERLGAYDRGAQLKLVGKAPGDGWYFVRAADGASGWMSALYLDLKGNFESLPRLEIAGSTVVHGLARSTDGIAGNGVRLKLSPPGDEPQRQLEFKTGAAGEFFFFLPGDVSGEWRLIIEGVDCASRLMDANCTMSEYFPLAFDQPVSLPHEAPLEVLYQKADLWIGGKVIDAAGKGRSGAWVLARRSDGAVSGQRSAAGGIFRLPAAAGAWQLRARSADTKGELVNIVLAAGAEPPPVELKLP